MTRHAVLFAVAALCALAGCGDDAGRDHESARQPSAHEGDRTAEDRTVEGSVPIPHPDAGIEAIAASFPEALPAAYTGVLPCADCEGIRHDLLLFPDEVFYLRTIYLGKPGDVDAGEGAAFYDIGRWMLSPSREILTLHGYGDDRMFALISGNRLRMLDRQGRRIESTLDYDLTAIDSLPQMEPRLDMRGMYVYFADTGMFEECSTGRRYPVSQEADNAALERAYSEKRMEPGRPLLATLTARIAPRPQMEGDWVREMIVVEHFEGVWPGETCGPRFSTAMLENTYWALVRLGGSLVSIPSSGRETHIRLVPGECMVKGHGGCNQITGSYVLDEGRLEFKGLISTRRACPDGMEQEQMFLAALDAVRTFRIRGEHMELSDAGGNLLLRFESRYMN